MLASAGARLAPCADTATWALSETELVASLEAVHRLEQQLAAVKLALVREVDGREVAAFHGASSTVVWLRDRLRIGPSQARTLVGLAEGLDAGSPAIRAALAAGLINAEQARVINDAVTALPADAGSAMIERAVRLLLDWADRFDPTVLRRPGQRVLSHVDPDTADAAQLAALQRAEERAQPPAPDLVDRPGRTGAADRRPGRGNRRPAARRSGSAVRPARSRRPAQSRPAASGRLG